MIRLTHETLAACYDFLNLTPPFASWGLPDSDDVLFKVGKFRTHFAHYQWDGRRHTITVSTNAVGHTHTLIEKMAHEMVHLRLEMLGLDDRGTKDTHSVAFRRLAAIVTREHGFDPKAFY